MDSPAIASRMPLEGQFGVFASRRPAMGACRVRGDRGMFDRAGRRLAKTWPPQALGIEIAEA